MTFPRRFAQAISNVVVVYASPGRKEWAKGLAREVAFVEGDWAALGWSLGSLRVLFDRRELPISTIEELAAAAEKYVQSQNKISWLTWFLPLTNGFILGRDLFTKTTPWHFIAFSFVVLGCLGWAIESFLDWRNALKVSSGLDDAGAIQHYKAFLERACNLYLSSMRWATGFLLLAGLYFEKLPALLAHPVWKVVIGLLLLLAFWSNLQLQRSNRRRLKQIDALLSNQQ